MTNGEKIKEIFPDTKIITQYDNPFGDRFMVFTLNNEDMQVNIEWWNAEYKEPSNSEKPNRSKIPTSSTTRNGISNRTIIYKAKESKDIQEDLEKLEKLNEPTTKNCESCGYYGSHHEVCNYCYNCSLWTEGVEAVEDQLPCGDQMDFTDTFEEFAKDYGFKDKDEISTNGIELIPVYRVKQWLEHISTTKNDLGIDAVSRSTILTLINDVKEANGFSEYSQYEYLFDQVDTMPPVTPIRPKAYWRTVDTNMYACSKCSHVLTIDPLDNSILEMNTCPFCSAKIDGVVEE